MERLLNHFFNLVKKNKLKNGNHKEILLDVVYENQIIKVLENFMKINIIFQY